MKKLISFDIGIKNPSYTIFYYIDDISEILNIVSVKDNWYKNKCTLDKNTLDDIISKYDISTTDTVIIERQRGRFIKLMSYIHGYFEGKGFGNVNIVNPFTYNLRLKSYRDRKKFSEILFKRFLSINNIDIEIPTGKIDDISDSFNLGILYLGKVKNNYDKLNIANINTTLETFNIHKYKIELNKSQPK